MNKKNITLHDIAKKTGYSLATVSRAINQTGLVKSKTYEEIMSAVLEMNYELPKPAALPVAHLNGLILFNVMSFTNPFYDEIINGVTLSAVNHGFQIVVNNDRINADTFDRIVALIKRTRATGIITTNYIPPEILRKLQSVIKVIQLCEYTEYEDCSYVTVDDLKSGYDVVNYLLAIGHKRIGLINGNNINKYSRHRRLGYLKALEEAGIPVDPKLIISLPDIHYETAVSAALQLLDLDNPPDAIFACSDVYAVATIRAANLRGRKIPDDFSLVGFDNIDVTSCTVPTISTVDQPKFQLGFTAAELLIEMITSPDTPTKQITLNAQLVLRESTRSR